MKLSDEALGIAQSIPTEGALINNRYPQEVLPGPRLALVGNWPFDEGERAPFSASVMGTLIGLLQPTGLSPYQCFKGNVCGWIPPWKTRKKFEWDYPLVEQSLKKLDSDLAEFNPQVIVLMGDLAMCAFKENPDRLDAERGAPFVSSRDGKTVCIATYHPTDIWARYRLHTLATFDLTKAKRIAQDGWHPTHPVINHLPTFNQVMQYLYRCLADTPLLSVDLETTYANHIITCLGIAHSSKEALVIPFTKGKGEPYWNMQQECVIWRLLGKVLEKCPLLGQNAVHFDHEILARKYGINANFVEDNMYAIWECYPELLKSLAFQSSLYTDNSYHKNLLKLARTGKIGWEWEPKYCGIDCCTTFECAIGIGKDLKDMQKIGPDVRGHYRFNVRVAKAFQYMSIKGVRLDQDTLKVRKQQLDMEAHAAQKFIEKECGSGFNVRSWQQVRAFLKRLSIPPQYERKKNEYGEYIDKETSDYLTLLKLSRTYPQYPILKSLGVHRKLLKRISALNGYTPRADGRMGWGFSLVATTTGRSAGYKPLDGYGVQPQNVDRRDQDLFLADEDKWWLKADLEGADSWTVAAQLVALGDTTLLDDLKRGMKPAQVLAIAMLFGTKLITAPVEELLTYKSKLKDITKDEIKAKGDPGKTTYHIAKRINHGSCYGLREVGMHKNIFKDSDGELWITPGECRTYRSLLFQRYPYEGLSNAMQTKMISDGYLDSAAGTRRHFLDRNDHNKIRDMLAHLPQAHTTFTANKVIERLFYNGINRDHNDKLILEPVNQVHDETDLMFEKGYESWVQQIFAGVSTVTLDVWGTEITIPFEAKYGPNWGSQPHDLPGL